MFEASDVRVSVERLGFGSKEGRVQAEITLVSATPALFDGVPHWDEVMDISRARQEEAQQADAKIELPLVKGQNQLTRVYKLRVGDDDDDPIVVLELRGVMVARSLKVVIAPSGVWWATWKSKVWVTREEGERLNRALFAGIHDGEPWLLSILDPQQSLV